MNAVTPPKLSPSFHSTAASGTLPIEQTKLSMATTGPTSGPQIAAATGCPVMKNARQKSGGTQAAMAPAMSRPITRSRRMAAHSITNTCDTDVNPSPDSSRRSSEPRARTDMSMAACPSMDPASPRSD